MRRQRVLGRRLLPLKAFFFWGGGGEEIRAACCVVEWVPHHPPAANGLGGLQGRRCRERVRQPGAPRRVGNCFPAPRWSIGAARWRPIWCSSWRLSRGAAEGERG